MNWVSADVDDEAGEVKAPPSRAVFIRRKGPASAVSSSPSILLLKTPAWSDQHPVAKTQLIQLADHLHQLGVLVKKEGFFATELFLWKYTHATVRQLEKLKHLLIHVVS